MAKAVWQGSITDAAGNIIPGASVEFKDADTDVLATLWTDRAGMTLAGNPVVDDDGDGFVRVYATKGRYKITATSAGMQRIWENVVLMEDTTLTPPARTEATATLSAGDNDDFTPDGWVSTLDGTGFLILEAGAGAANLTGLPPGAADQKVSLYNADTTNAVDLVVEDAGSTAAWRFAGIGRSLLPGMTVSIHYVASMARWVIV